MKKEYIIWLTGLIIAIALFTIPNAQTLLQTIQEDKEHFYASTSVGTSMYPTIKQGDTLIIMEKDYPGFTINTGDIIVYEINNNAIAHRVVGRYCCGYLAKGDNSPAMETVSYNQIIGKVVQIR